MEFESLQEDRTALVSSTKSVSAPTSPTESGENGTQNLDLYSIDLRSNKGRRVKFPSDDVMVTNYFEASDPWYNIAPQLLTPENLLDAYRSACEKQGIKPIPRLLSQLEEFSVFNLREHDLQLKGEKLDARQCEALEEVFKRIQFRTIDLDSCNLDDEGASALFDMLEYYESATHLNISNNKGIDIRGWQACCRMLKKTSCLQHLELRNSALSEQVMLIFGRALRLGSHIVTLHLESSGISSRGLAILIAALKLNANLRELYLCDNKLNQSDGIQVANLLRANSTLELLDLRGNQLQDIGLGHIAEGLSQQPAGPGDGLKVLVLCDNQITSKGISHLVEALPFCRALKSLNVGFNNLGNDGVIRLKDGLMACSSLLYLGLRSTKVGCEGAVSIAECIAEDRKIKKIDLRDNNIQTAGLMALALAMKHNSHITRLDITLMNADPSCQKFLADIDTYVKFNQREEEEGEDVDDDQQGLESPDPAVCSSSPIPLLSLNGLFKPVLNLPFAGLNKKDSHNKHSAASSFSPKPSPTRTRSRVSSAHVEHEDISVPKHLDDKLENTAQCSHSRNGNLSLLNTQQQHQTSPKPILRSTSLGSWDRRHSETEIRRSGRFSVSPVPDSSFNLSHMGGVLEHSVADEPTRAEVNKAPNVRSKAQQNEPVEKGKEPQEASEKTKKRISFLLPEASTESLDSGKYNKNRRMSTPAISANAAKKKKLKLPSFKTLKTIDGLDLKSSVPLSPTRLCQAWDFTDVSSLRLPPEVEEVVARLELMPLTE